MSPFFSSMSDQISSDKHSNNLPLVTFNIVKGQTRYRTRHIFKNRYLIGSDENCDLQLGDSNIPKLHSILLYDGQAVKFEAIAESPMTFINNQKRSEAILTEGDFVKIGKFEMQIDKITRNSKTTAEQEDNFDSLADLSAIQLVNQIETELNSVERVEKQKQLGVSALMQAIQSSGTQDDKLIDIAAEHEPQIISQIEQIVNCLQEISQELDLRAEQISQRERQYLAVAAQLLDSQQQLTGQLETLADHMPHLLPQLQRHRASA